MANQAGILNHVAFFGTDSDQNQAFILQLRDLGFTGDLVPFTGNPLEAVQRIRPAVLLLDIHADPEVASATLEKIKSEMVNLPLVLLLDNEHQDVPSTPLLSSIDGIAYRGMPPAHLAALLRGYVRQSFTIQELLQSNRNLNEISITDSLTALFNRGYMIDRLNLEFKRASRNHEPLSCLMIDLDHFKQINDTYGHNFGDIVLKAVSSRLKELIRETDIFGRYGGEEFLILLPNTSIDGASYLAEKLRQGLESKRIVHEYFSLLVTASFGVASTEIPEVITPDHLLQLSDRALYRAKESGRNRVCVSSSNENIVPETDISHARSSDDIVVVDLVSPRHENCPLYEYLNETNGFQLHVHQTTEDFFDTFRNREPSLIMIDQEGGGLDALEICNEIKKHVQDYFIPIVLIVAEHPPFSSKKLVEAGVSEQFPVSLNKADMEVRLQTLLHIKDLHDRWRHTYRDLTMARTRLIKVERLTALGEMATGVAHDFNNILSTVLGRTQLMRQKTRDKSILKNLAVIEQAANDGAATIRRIQGFSRVTTDHAYEVLDLVQVVHDCIQMTRTRWKDEAEMHGVLYRVRRIFPESLPVIGSMAELREVVTNLIMNALDAMPSGGELTFEGKAVNGDAVLTVRDSGAGMDESIVKRIFDPFFSTKKGEGTGLGLSVAYGIIARHNGRIECTSEPGEGTVFRIFLPRSSEIGDTFSDMPADDKLDTSVVETDREAEEFSEKRSLKVLIIDDEQPIRDILSELLGEEGHEPLEAASGEKALQIIKSKNVDLVFTDLSMPGMNGWEVAERIHKHLPAVPIILTSGWGSDFNFDRLTQSGICHILPKPVPIDAFMEIIQRTMKGEPIRLDDEY